MTMMFLFLFFPSDLKKKLEKRVSVCFVQVSNSNERLIQEPGNKLNTKSRLNPSAKTNATMAVSWPKSIMQSLVEGISSLPNSHTTFTSIKSNTSESFWYMRSCKSCCIVFTGLFLDMLWEGKAGPKRKRDCGKLWSIYSAGNRVSIPF